MQNSSSCDDYHVTPFEYILYTYEEANFGDPPCSYMSYCKQLEKAITGLDITNLSFDELSLLEEIKLFIADCPEEEIPIEDQECSVHYYKKL